MPTSVFQGVTMGEHFSKLEFQFIAKDSAGKEYTLNVYGEYSIIRTRGGTSEERYGTRITTVDGTSVNKLSQGKYHVQGPLAEVLESDDPRAP